MRFTGDGGSKLACHLITQVADPYDKGDGQDNFIPIPNCKAGNFMSTYLKGVSVA